MDYIIEQRLFKYILLINCNNQKDELIEIKNGEFRPLNYKMKPLNKYNAKLLYTYNNKDVCLIEVN